MTWYIAEVLAQTNEGFWDSNVASAIVGAVSGLVGVYIGEYFARLRSKRADLEAYRNTLWMTLNELNFYVPKLSQMNVIFAQVVKDMDARQPIELPGFALDATLLNECRKALASRSDAGSVVTEVSNFSYEMSHIQRRINAVYTKVDNIYNESAIMDKTLYRPTIIKQQLLGEVTKIRNLTATSSEALTKSIAVVRTAIDAQDLGLSRLVETFDLK
jgi:hypothetical protein